MHGTISQKKKKNMPNFFLHQQYLKVTQSSSFSSIEDEMRKSIWVKVSWVGLGLY